MPGPVARSLKALVVSAFVASVSACGSSAPAGFEAVPPASPPRTGAVCPDLRGTYVPGDDALMRSFLDTPRPDNYGHQVLLTILGEPGGVTTATWHMDRAEFMAQARQMRELRPAQYARWRERVLGRDRTMDPARYVQQVTEIGPFFSIGAGISGRQCADAWQLVAVRDDPDKPLEREVWLARNRDGALLVKTAVREVTSLGILDIRARLGPGEITWARLTPVASADPAMITSADLP